MQSITVSSSGSPQTATTSIPASSSDSRKRKRSDSAHSLASPVHPSLSPVYPVPTTSTGETTGETTRSPSIMERKCDPTQTISDIVTATGKSLLNHLNEFDVILKGFAGFSDSTSPTTKPDRSPEKSRLARLHKLSANMVLCQNLLGTEEVQSSLEAPTTLNADKDPKENPAGTIVKNLEQLSKVQRQNLEKFNFLIHTHAKTGHALKHIFKEEPVVLSLWQTICETNTAIKSHAAQLYRDHLNEAPPHSPASGLHWSVADPTTLSPEEEGAVSPEKSLRRSPRRSPRRKQQGTTLSPDDKKEILKKTRELLKKAFPKREKPYSGRTVQGRMYEIVVQLALQKAYGGASVCDTNSVKANFPVFDLIWKEGDIKRFVSLKCHLSKSAKERAAQISRDMRLSDEKLEDQPELLANAIHRHYQQLQGYLNSPVRRAVQRLQQSSPNSPTYFDKCEDLHLDVSENASRSQIFIITRSTMREAVKKDKASARQLATMDFSTEELRDFMGSLEENIAMKWRFSKEEDDDPDFAPRTPKRKSKVRKPQKRLSFS